MKRITLLCASWVIFFSLALPCFPAEPPQAVKPAAPEVQPLTVVNIRGSVYQVKGGDGANTGFFIGPKEVIAIDAKMTPESAKLMAGEIKKLTSLPLTTMLVTHSDQDHVNGLTGFPEGVMVISQEKTRVHMDKAFKSASERAFLPRLTFGDHAALYAYGPDRPPIRLLYFGPAHTDGDAIYLFPAERVAFIGDLIFMERDQLIHRHKNGTSFGLVTVLKSLLDLDADLFLSGHSNPVTKSELARYVRTIEDKQARVSALAMEGKTLAEVKAALGEAGPAVQSPPSRWPSLTEVIYGETAPKK